MLGKLLDRRYQVTQVLGAGGFGRTYLAQDTRRPGNPTCVVKQLKPVSTDPIFLETARRLFTSEAETLEQLGNHAQIPRLLAYFEEDQEFYLVQEFIEGHTLSQELQPGQRWEERGVIELLQEVLSVLEFVHNQGVIHRDIKPDNLIRRNSDNKLVLVDFGAVKQIRTQLATAYGQASATVAVGTPGYMPSEQARGQPRPNSDIYALGIIGIQALTGLMPVQFQEDLSTGEIIWEQLVPVSRGLAAIITRMVRYHFKDRYQSASEALQALGHLSGHYPPTHYPTVPIYPSANNVPASGQRLPRSTYPAPASGHNTLPASPAPPPRQPVAAPPNYIEPPRSNNVLPLILTGIAIAFVAGLGMTYAIGQGSLGRLVGGDRNNDRDTSQGTCTVKTGGLNVRSEPVVKENNVVDTVTKGTSLALSGTEENGWVEISSPVKGWVFKRNDLINCTSARQKPVETIARQKPVETIATQKPVETPTPKKSPDKPKPVDNGSKALETAAEKYQSGDLQGAIAQAQTILASGSAAKKDAVAKIAQWQQEWASAEAKFNEVQKALNEGRWDDVLVHESDSGFPEQRYWRDRLNQVIEEAKKKKAEAEASKEEPTPPETPQPEQPKPEPTDSGTPSPAPTEPSPGT
jgi:serine/threonine-protein kinase